MRKRLLQVCRVLSAFMLLMTLVGCGTRESRARKHHQKGLLYARNHRLREASERFKKALSLDPKNQETHYELARVYLSQRRLSDAQKEFRKAIEIKPDYSQAHFGLATALFADREIEEAIQVCQTAIEKKPDYAQAHGLLGDIHRDQGQTDKAIAEYRKALAKKPNLMSIRAILGKTLFTAGKVDEARQVALTTVEKFDSGDFDAHMLLSEIFQKEKRYDKAIEEAKLALEKNKGRATAHLMLALLYLRTSQFDLAFKEAQQAMRSRGTQVGALFVRGSVQFHREKFSEAVMDLQSALRSRADWAEARYLLARALYKNNQPGMAASEYGKLLQDLPEFDEARLQLALISLEQEWFSQAEFHCKKVLEHDPRERQALQCLERVYDVQGKSEEAALIRARLDAVISGGKKTELQIAVETLARGDADGAIEKCVKALEGKPDDAGFLNVLGLAYLRKEDLEEASKQFRRAIEANPSSISSYLNLSSVLLMQEKYDEAARQCQLALLKSPNSSALHYRLGTVYRLQKKDEDALKEFRAAAEADPKNVPAHSAVVDMLIGQKKQKDALTYCQQVIEQFPNMAQAYECAARVYQAMGEPDNAIAELNKAIEKDKSLFSARLRLAKVYLGEKKILEARKEAEQLLRLMSGRDADSVFVDLAPIYEQVGEFEAATADVEAVAGENEDNIAARLILAHLHCLAGKFDQAAREVQGVLATREDLADLASAHYILGWIHARQRRGSESIIEFRKALVMRPGWVAARLMLSDVLKADGRHQEAIVELNTVLERFPDHLPALLSIAESELKAGLLDSAQRHCSRAVEIEPKNTGALRLLGDTLATRGNIEEAQQVYSRIQEISPSAASAPAFAAAAQLFSGRPDEAIATCQKAISSGSKDARVYNILGLAQLSKELHTEAKSSFRESIALDASFLPARINLATAHNAAGEPDLAVKELRNVLSLSPKASWVRTRLAETLVSQKKYSQAAEEFQTALEESNNDPRIALLAGQNYLVLKNYEEAGQMFRIVVASTRNQSILASAYNNLAWIACMEGRDLQQALSLAAKADELQPGDGNILDTIGWILYKLGRYAEAVEKLTSAVAKGPDTSSIRYHLGMALFKSGQGEQALHQLKAALSLSSTFDDAEEARRIIAELEEKK
ncbi:tetratricopeptide repeat protein [bacterium]|nr:tetratricopeptide repeat protein [bacterium]